MGSRGSTLVAPLERQAGYPPMVAGTLVIRGSEIRGGNDHLRVKFRCSKLDRKDWMGSSDPFIVANRLLPDGSRVKVRGMYVLSGSSQTSQS